MLGTRFEEYSNNPSLLPFILNIDLERSSDLFSREKNWHDELEIQLCTQGSGTVLLNGEKLAFNENDIVVVKPNVIHYTGSQERLVYSCLIIKTSFCKQMNIDCDKLYFSSIIKDENIVNLFKELIQIYIDETDNYKIAKLNQKVLQLLLLLVEKHSETKTDESIKDKEKEKIKSVIKYIRLNYDKKISLEGISQYFLLDKYALCRAFKKNCGQTITNYLNEYRCMQACEFLKTGKNTSETARLCGFDNLSYFTKTFKKFIKVSPSQYKQQYK